MDRRDAFAGAGWKAPRISPSAPPLHPQGAAHELRAVALGSLVGIPFVLSA